MIDLANLQTGDNAKKVLTCFLLTFAIQVVPLSVVRRFYDGVMGEVFGVGVYFLSFFICLTIIVYLVKRWGTRLL